MSTVVERVTTVVEQGAKRPISRDQIARMEQQ
jgi:hypothetical protein